MTKSKQSKTESDSSYLAKLKTLTIGVSFNISDKIEKQRRDHAADIVQPHTYDKSKRKLVLDPAFVKLYPDKVRYYETPENIAKQGYPKLAEYTRKLNKASQQLRDTPQFEGHEAKAIKKIIK